MSYKLNYEGAKINELLAKTDGMLPSNRNLLDNPFFQINQRGQTEYTVGTSQIYCVDRWLFGWYGVVKVSENGLSINKQASATNTTLIQRLEPSLVTELTGKTVTLSVMKNDGTVVSKSGVFGSFNIGITNNLEVDCYNNQIRFISRSETDYYIRAVKLELGTVSTLANDVAPDYGSELAKCQRYYYQQHFAQYQTIAQSYQGASWTNVYFPLPVLMRTTPSAELDKNLSYAGGYPTTSIKNPTNLTLSGSVAILGYSTTATTQGAGYVFCADAQGLTIIFKADL